MGAITESRESITKLFPTFFYYYYYLVHFLISWLLIEANKHKYNDFVHNLI
jgi:hypothetical protein